MAVDHYENFPVASLLLPPRLRAPVAAIYRYARHADDIADEGEAAPEARLAALDELRADLDRIARGAPARTPVCAVLAPVIAEHALPLQPLRDLLDAFAQDVRVQRYASFAELREYCRRSADPVGRLMLALYRADDPTNRALSDDICTSLQLINFWQDIALDWRKGRVYLPQEDLARFDVGEAQIAAGEVDARWRALIGFQAERARALMLRGAPLARRLPGRIGLELRLVVQGGLRILERIQQAGGDVFRRRPTLRARDWALLGWRALRA